MSDPTTNNMAEMLTMLPKPEDASFLHWLK
jgi:hypothetical protein